MANHKGQRKIYLYDPESGEKTLTCMKDLKIDDIFCIEDSDGVLVEPTDDRICWICQNHPALTDNKYEDGARIYGVIAAPYPLREEEDGH